MKNSVKVSIRRTPDGFEIRNNRGMKWEYLTNSDEFGHTVAYGLGSLAASILGATIGRQIFESYYSEEYVEFELSYERKATETYRS